jgi:hypothetical protein
LAWYKRASVIAGKHVGLVDYEPWLTSGADDASQTGFQPTASCNGTSADNDGDGIDNGDDCEPNNPEVTAPTWYQDNDGDGFGTIVKQCKLYSATRLRFRQH